LEWQKYFDTATITEEEFVCNFRVDRSHFARLLLLIQDHPKIRRRDPAARGGYKIQYTPDLHLLVTLKYLGSEGNGATAMKLKEGLGISKGSIHAYVIRTVEAILSLREETVF